MVNRRLCKCADCRDPYGVKVWLCQHLIKRRIGAQRRGTNVPGCRRMCDNIAADGLLGIHAAETCIVHLRNDLICYDDSYAKLIRKAHECAKEPSQMRLSR